METTFSLLGSVALHGAAENCYSDGSFARAFYFKNGTSGKKHPKRGTLCEVVKV